MIENKKVIYTASGNTLELAFLDMSRYINQKYIQGENDEYTPFKRSIKTV